MILSKRECEYLKEFYASDETLLTPTYFSKKYGVARATAQKIINKLNEKGFLLRIKGKGYILSNEGRRMASYLYRRHMVLEYALWKAGLSKEYACILAAKIENGLSEEDVETLWLAVGKPTKCPCGYSIPEVKV